MKAANENLPILIRHPRMAVRWASERNKQQDDGSADNGGAGNNDKEKLDNDSEDIDAELERIRALAKWRNWIELVIRNKRTLIFDRQVGASETLYSSREI